MKINHISILRHCVQILYLTIFISGIISKNYVMIFITATAILLGPIFCGWMCFVGFYQDICRWIGSFIKKEPYEIDTRIQKYLTYSRYLFFILALVIGGIFLFPGKVWGSFAGLIKGHFILNLAVYFIIALGIISLVTRRFFCRYLCTFGAKLGLFSLLRPITINQSKDCISCQLCSKECLMGIDVDKANSLANPSCINCFKCIEVCPKKCLKIGIRNYLNP